MSVAGEEEMVVVLNTDVVRWGIARLQSRRIHQFFLAYLNLRRWAFQADIGEGITPTWNELAPHMQMEGGPPNKPHFRPFSSQHVNDPASYWMNPNLAGSWAPSSLRANARRVIDTADDGTFSLRQNHAELALEHLLYGERLSATAFAAYWYRDYGFVPRDGFGVGPNDLVGAFAFDFGFVGDDTSFDVLFVVDAPENPIIDMWFEPFVETAAAGA